MSNTQTHRIQFSSSLTFRIENSLHFYDFIFCFFLNEILSFFLLCTVHIPNILFAKCENQLSLFADKSFYAQIECGKFMVFQELGHLLEFLRLQVTIWIRLKIASLHVYDFVRTIQFDWWSSCFTRTEKKNGGRKKNLKFAFDSKIVGVFFFVGETTNKWILIRWNVRKLIE